MATRKHKIEIVAEQSVITGWTSYEVEISMINACSSFRFQRAFDRDVWDLLERDTRVRILVDGTCILDGFIDRRSKASNRDDGSVIEIEGRDWAGRVVDESAPALRYDGLTMQEAIRRLVTPWYKEVTLSNARDRALRRGKGYKVATGNEPIVVHTSRQGGGRVHPGQSRNAVIDEILSEAGLVGWGSADGRTFFVGEPNRNQVPQYLLHHVSGGSRRSSTVVDLRIDEDNGDRYSLIACVGAGGATEQDFGIQVSSRRAYVVDNEDNVTDGTGRDFKYPKRLLMPEKDFGSYIEASQIAGAEQARRDFRRLHITATCQYHGQPYGPGAMALFAIDTIANVVDEEIGFDEDCIVYATSFRSTRDGAETTRLELVPKDTQITR